MTAVEVVERAYAALERREGAALLELLDERIVWRLPDVLPFGGEQRGRDAVGAVLARVWEHVFDWGAQLHDVVEVGDDVVALGRHPVVTPDGVIAEVPFVAVWRVRDGCVVAFEEHLDTLQLLRALGRSATG